MARLLEARSLSGLRGHAIAGSGWSGQRGCGSSLGRLVVRLAEARGLSGLRWSWRCRKSRSRQRGRGRSVVRLLAGLVEVRDLSSIAGSSASQEVAVEDFPKEATGQHRTMPRRRWTGGGSAPEIRLLVKMAAARGVSGGRGGRLWRWPGRATSRPPGGLWPSGGEAAERSGFVQRCPKSCRCGAGREHDGRLWNPRFVRASSVAGCPVWGWVSCCCRHHVAVVMGGKQGNGSITRLIRHRPRPPGIPGHRRLSGFRRGRSGQR